MQTLSKTFEFKIRKVAHFIAALLDLLGLLDGLLLDFLFAPVLQPCFEAEAWVEGLDTEGTSRTAFPPS